MAKMPEMPKRDSWYSIHAKKDQPNVVEVYIYDEIGYWGVSSADFVASWNAAVKNADEVHLHINSPGGDAADAFTIYNLVKNSNKKVVGFIDGWAVSAASLAAMACSPLKIAANALMMIHEPWTFKKGNAVELRAAADQLEMHSESMAEMYALKSGKTVDECKQIMQATTWYRAQAAVDAGFADEVYSTLVNSTAAQAKFDPKKYEYKNLQPEFVAAALVLVGSAEDGEEETAIMPIPKVEDQPAPDSSVDVGQIRSEAIAAERARASKIRSAAFPGQEELVDKLIADGASVEDAVCSLNSDQKAKSAQTLEGFKAASEEVQIVSSSAPGEEATAKVVTKDDVRETVIKSQLRIGKTREEAEAFASRFVG